MTKAFFGFQFVQQDDTLPPVLSDFSIGYIVTWSNDANPTIFPLDKPVAINSGDPTVLAGAGTGELYKSLLRINAQLATFQVSARLVVVRVLAVYEQDGVTVDKVATMANVLGNAGAKTGLYAVLTAPQVCNAVPRLGIVPGGLTGLMFYAVATPVVTNPGAGYTHPVVTFNPAGATATATVGNTGSQATAHSALTSGGVGPITVDNGGSGYESVPAVTITGGGGTGAAAHAVLTAGVVSSIVVDTAGTGYTSAPTITVSAPIGGEITAINLTSPGQYTADTAVTMTITDSQGGTGAGATATVSMELLQNPICALLPTINNALLAHSLVAGPGTTVQDALAWRGTLNSQRLIAQDDWEIVETIDGTGDEYLDGTARSLGLAIATDFEHSGYPFHAWANRPIVDALGVKRPDGFSLTDGATDGQVLLTAGIGITARGDASDTSIDDSGFVAISVNNTSSDGNYNLYNKTRGDDFINLALVKTIRKRLGKNNITRKGIDAVLNDMTAINVAIMSLDDPGILGFQVGFKAANNTVAGLRQGQFTVFDNTEIPAPIIQITINRGLDADAVTSLLQQLASDGTSATAS
ncbi:MAG: hypothetical protein ACRYGP_13905 [Janthinobacterium lividum]